MRSLGARAWVCRRECGGFWRTVLCAVLLAAMRELGWATENGASVYPVGVETVLPGMTAAPGQTMLCEFTNFYSANAMVDGNGKNTVPDFKVSVWATALKVDHTWHARLLGGTLRSSVAVPLVYHNCSFRQGNFKSLVSAT
jgi:hypothetical protein